MSPIVIKEYNIKGATVIFHDTYIKKKKNEIDLIKERLGDIYIKNYKKFK